MTEPKLPPSDLLEQISNDPSAENFLSSFPIVRQAVQSYLEQAGFDLSSFHNILDLGCGVGRFLFAMRDVLRPEQNLFGCDVDERCATWCVENIDFARIDHVSIYPPLPYPARKFDFVYALSIFTHLTAEFQFRWAWELYRVLRPGGVVFLTTHHMGHLSEMFQSMDLFSKREVRLLGSEGLLIVLAKDSSREIEGQREVAVAHSRAALKEIFSACILKEFVPISVMAGGQSVTILQRPIDSENLVFPANREDACEPIPDRIGPGSSESKGLDFLFDLKGPARFQAYLEFDARIHFGNMLRVRYEVAIEGKSQSSEGGSLPLPINSLFGRGHFCPISFPIETLPAVVRIRLVLELERGTPASSGIGFNWRLTRCEQTEG